MNVHPHCNTAASSLCEADSPNKLLPGQTVKAIREDLYNLLLVFRGAGDAGSPDPSDPSDDRPALPPPCCDEHHTLEMMWLQSLFDRVQRALGSLTREQLEGAQSATRQVVQANLSEIDKQVEAKKKAEADAKKARINNLLKQIAAVVFVIVIAVVAATAAVSSGGAALPAIGAFLALLSVVGALYNLAGAARGIQNPEDGFTLTSHWEKAGAGGGSDSLAAIFSGDIIGLVTEGAVEAAKANNHTSDDVMLVSIIVTVALLAAVLVVGYKFSKTDNGAQSGVLKKVLKSIFDSSSKFAVCLSAIGSVQGSLCNLEAADARHDAAESQSASARRDAQIEQLEQVAARLMEILQSMMSELTRSFKLMTEMIDQWTAALTELHDVSGPGASMA